MWCPNGVSRGWNFSKRPMAGKRSTGRLQWPTFLLESLCMTVYTAGTSLPISMRQLDMAWIPPVLFFMNKKNKFRSAAD